MPFSVIVNDVEVKCDTFEEVEQVLARVGGRPRLASAKRERRAVQKDDGRSVGVSKGWAIAQWYGLSHNMTPNDARPALAKMKKQQNTKYQGFVTDFEKFAAWYANKIGKESPQDGIDALRSLYLDDNEAYKKAADEFKRKKGGN